jgi:hypothetical protein
MDRLGRADHDLAMPSHDARINICAEGRRSGSRIRKGYGAVALPRVGVCVAVVMVSLACAQPHPKAAANRRDVPKTLQAAEAHLKEMVDATANVVGVGLRVQADNAFLPTGCEDSAGRSDGSVSSPYSVILALPVGTDAAALFERARTFWRDNGYIVGTDDLTTSDPRLLLSDALDGDVVATVRH